MFKNVNDRRCQAREFADDGLKDFARWDARKPGHDVAEGSMIECPIGGDALLHACGNHLGDVTPRQGHLLAKNAEHLTFGDRSFGQSGEFIGPGHDRTEIKAKGLLDAAGARPARVAFAVRAVPSQNEPAVDERREVAAQGRGRYSVGAQAEKPI